MYNESSSKLSCLNRQTNERHYYVTEIIVSEKFCSRHLCMVSSVTPLWRNGPEDKPVLCNACGSRYKKRGSLGLEDYLPKNFQPKFFDKYKYKKGRRKSSCFNLFMLQMKRFIL